MMNQSWVGQGIPQTWQSYTPALGNLSGGTINYAKYIQIGKTVHVRFKYTLAGAGVAGEVTVALPVAAHADYANSTITPLLSSVALRDTGTATFIGGAYWGTGQVAVLRFGNASGSTQGLSSTVPFTWANTDIILFELSYEAA